MLLTVGSFFKIMLMILSSEYLNIIFSGIGMFCDCDSLDVGEETPPPPPPPQKNTIF